MNTEFIATEEAFAGREEKRRFGGGVWYNRPRPGLNMIDPDYSLLLQGDCDSLRELAAGLERLEAGMADARQSVAARDRGYFTPDEDERVRQLLLAYRSHRLALWEIIRRYFHYAQIGEETARLRGFMVGFAAALLLYAKSLKLIETYEGEPLIRKKLNEADEKFGLEAGFFEEVLGAFSSLSNYRHLLKAAFFWRGQRRRARDLGVTTTEDGAWLAETIRCQRPQVKKRLVSVLARRLRYDWSLFWRTTLYPVKKTRYGIQSWVGGTFAGARTTRHYQPGIGPGVLSALGEQLRPGDILLMRAEQKLTSALLPGFWAHAALYIGCREELRALGVEGQPHLAKHWETIPPARGSHGHVIEAVSPRTRLAPLEQSLAADHVAVLRPNVAREDMAAALAEAFGHLGKPYDFEFDFNVTTRIVCTELLYRCFHRRGPIEFPLVKRLGRFTLSGNDVMGLFLEGSARPPESRPFQLVALALKGAESAAAFVPEGEALERLRQIQAGWRPAHPQGQKGVGSDA